MSRNDPGRSQPISRSLEADQALSGWVEIGKILAPQGLNGEVRVYPDSDFPERFESPGQRWLLAPGSSEPEGVELRRGRYLSGKGLYVIQFAEITNREQAEARKGYRLLVPERDRPLLEEGEFYLLDLLGLEVFNQHTQAVIGSIVSIVPAGNDLLEVKTNLANPSTVLIPLVREIVPIIDLQNRRVEIAPPPGLLAL
jgi:16S rRNA processing protein RimM